MVQWGRQTQQFLQQPFAARASHSVGAWVVVQLSCWGSEGFGEVEVFCQMGKDEEALTRQEGCSRWGKQLYLHRCGGI